MSAHQRSRPLFASLLPSEPPAPVQRFTLGALLRDVYARGFSADQWPLAQRYRVGGVFLLALICSWLGIALSRQSDGVATIWLSNGIIFGFLITQPPRRWVAYFVAGLCADTLADVIHGDQFLLAFGVSVANSFEVMSSAIVLTLLFGSPVELYRRKPLVGFLLVSVVGATAVTSMLGAWWTGVFVEAGPFWALTRTWWLGDMLGMATLAPLLVILQRPGFFSILYPQRLRGTLLILLVPLLTVVLVSLDTRDPLLFFLFPALLLVAFRIGYPGTVITLALVMLLVIGLTIKARGPMMLITGQHMLLRRIIVAQIFVAVAIFTMFPVAALLEEKDALKLSLSASEQNFRDLAHHDELTGLCNRRGFNLRFEQAWQSALHCHDSLAMLMLDVDHFKHYNDAYGHLHGDVCLQNISQVLAEAVEDDSGIVARYGGEEFVVVLPGSDCDQALSLAEVIRLAAQHRAVPHPTSPLGVQTVSIGVAAIVPQAGQRSMELINLCDAALYQAKLLGRNQVGCA